MGTKEKISNSSIRKIPPKIAGGPGRYIQGPDALALLGEILGGFGENPLIVSDDIVWSILGEGITAELEASDLKPVLASFGGECSHSEIDRITTYCRESGCRQPSPLRGLKGAWTVSCSLKRSGRCPRRDEGHHGGPCRLLWQPCHVP